MDKITPHLWYTKEAEEAARFYVTLLPGSRIDHVTVMPGETPSGPEGSVVVVEFTLAGQSFMAMSAGELDPFNHAVSFMINCDDQGEIDRIWDAILQHGGKPEQCGWIRDRYGLCWQVAPTQMGEWMRSKDRAAARRVTEAMLKMVKLDIATLSRAFAGK